MLSTPPLALNSPFLVDEEEYHAHGRGAGFPPVGGMARHPRQVPYIRSKSSQHQRGCKKGPGRDGIVICLFQATFNALKDWLDLFSQMFAPGNLTEQQKRGVVCITKTTRPKQPSDYRPITLLNTDYKILARIVANQFRPTLQELLHPSQFCGRPGNTISDAIASVREAIAFAEVKRKSMCILTLDLKEAFH